MLRLTRTNYILNRLTEEFKSLDKHGRGTLKAKEILRVLNHIDILTARNVDETRDLMKCLASLPLTDPVKNSSEQGRPVSQSGRPASRASREKLGKHQPCRR